jgi:DNA-binding transcriptional LysR family regulator
MTMGPLDSYRLETFVRVAREGGFSRAARALGRTQSSVSEAVALLEEDLGRRLFLRDARATRLTDEGRVLLEHAERILDEMQAARTRLEHANLAAEGELVLGTTDTLACYLLPPVFAALRKKYPKVQLRLDNRPSPGVAMEVLERRIHVGVVSLPLPPAMRVGGRPILERLRVETLTSQQDVVICPPAHRLARRRAVTALQLVQEPLILLDRTTSTRALLERSFQALGRTPTVVMETRSVDVLKRLVELDFGVSVVPSMAVAREVKARSLVARPLRGLDEARSVGLVTHAAPSLPAAARVFIELALSILRQ